MTKIGNNSKAAQKRKNKNQKYKSMNKKVGKK
jgi:hypothetical protein